MRGERTVLCLPFRRPEGWPATSDTDDIVSKHGAKSGHNLQSLSRKHGGARMTLLIRPARLDELESLLAMQLRSMRLLCAPCYTREVLEAALAEMGTMDPRLIADGTYLVADLAGQIVGGAGWTMRPPNYARLLCHALAPLPGAPGVVRSVYVDPVMARQGIARRLMEAVEKRLSCAGAEAAELMATLSGVPFYAAIGYRHVSDHALLLGERMEFPVRRMLRPLAGLSRGVDVRSDCEPGTVAPRRGTGIWPASEAGTAMPIGMTR
jgi:GNAT superfamily N-acetyltransferase